MNKILVSAVGAFFFFGNAFANPPAIPSKKESNLLSPAVVKTSLISITVPQGWSYLLATPWGNSVHSTEHLVITPTSPVEKSSVGITISDQIPHASFNAEKLANLKTPPLTVQTANWGGKNWHWVEETHVNNSVKMVHWIADTTLKDRDLQITANFPVADDAKSRAVFTQILQSIQVNQ